MLGLRENFSEPSKISSNAPSFNKEIHNPIFHGTFCVIQKTSTCYICGTELPYLIEEYQCDIPSRPHMDNILRLVNEGIFKFIGYKTYPRICKNQCHDIHNYAKRKIIKNPKVPYLVPQGVLGEDPSELKKITLLSAYLDFMARNKIKNDKH